MGEVFHRTADRRPNTVRRATEGEMYDDEEVGGAAVVRVIAVDPRPGSRPGLVRLGVYSATCT
jgi:hypothetical protein